MGLNLEVRVEYFDFLRNKVDLGCGKSVGDSWFVGWIF